MTGGKQRRQQHVDFSKHTHTQKKKIQRDTLRLDLRESLDLTRAAGQRLGHHKQQVGVFYPLGVEQPAGETVTDV